MSGSKFASGACHKSMWRMSAYQRGLDECCQDRRDERRASGRRPRPAPRILWRAEPHDR
jgi:hypothetical protein